MQEQSKKKLEDRQLKLAPAGCNAEANASEKPPC
jgi:hypothetical protein